MTKHISLYEHGLPNGLPNFGMRISFCSFHWPGAFQISLDFRIPPVIVISSEGSSTSKRKGIPFPLQFYHDLSNFSVSACRYQGVSQSTFLNISLSTLLDAQLSVFPFFGFILILWEFWFPLGYVTEGPWLANCWRRSPPKNVDYSIVRWYYIQSWGCP